MKLIDDLLQTLPIGHVEEVRIGPFWTAVVVTTKDGHRQCGLASTLRRSAPLHEAGPEVETPGQLANRSTPELTALINSQSLMEASVGMATLNALLPRLPQTWETVNAEDVIAQRGAGKRVVVVGHFPFIPRLGERVGTLHVLEKNPSGNDLPAEAAAEVIPQADLVAITGTTLINGTFEGLLALCRPETMVMVLGPSTPLSPRLFEYGIDFISGSIVEDIDSVLRAVSQGGNFRQVHRQGVRLVTMQKGTRH